jgi:hypothetical protein
MATAVIDPKQVNDTRTSSEKEQADKFLSVRKATDLFVDKVSTLLNSCVSSNKVVYNYKFWIRNKENGEAFLTGLNSKYTPLDSTCLTQSKLESLKNRI